MSRFLAVKNFERFQHYGDRRPIWIKLYTSLLDDWDFLQLPDAVRGQLMLFWLLAATHGNRIRNDATYIRRKLATKKLYIRELVDAGWLLETDEPPLAQEPKRKPRGASTSASHGVSDPASNMASTPASEPASASASNGASTAASVEKEERRGDGEENSTTTGAGTTDGGDGHAGRFEKPRHRLAYVGIRRAAQNPLSFDFEVELLAEGGERPGSGLQPPFGWETVGEALHQISTNGGPATSRALQGFCAKLASGAEPSPAAATLTVTRGGGRRADDAGEVLAELRSRVEEIRVPGQGVQRVLRRERLEELGPAVVKAVEAVGGVRVLIDVAPDRMWFLIRDFGAALARARGEAA